MLSSLSPLKTSFMIIVHVCLLCAYGGMHVPRTHVEARRQFCSIHSLLYLHMSYRIKTQVARLLWPALYMLGHITGFAFSHVFRLGPRCVGWCYSSSKWIFPSLLHLFQTHYEHVQWHVSMPTQHRWLVKLNLTLLCYLFGSQFGASLLFSWFFSSYVRWCVCLYSTMIYIMFCSWLNDFMSYIIGLDPLDLELQGL